MALTIHENEMDLMKKLTRPAFAAISPTNDLYSWKKEYAEAQRDGMPRVVNAIWVLMGELSISEAEAMEVCGKKIKDSLVEFQGILKTVSDDSGISLDLRKYVEALQYSHSGNVIWSIYCPRYGYRDDAVWSGQPQLSRSFEDIGQNATTLAGKTVAVDEPKV